MIIEALCVPDIDVPSLHAVYLLLIDVRRNICPTNIHSHRLIRRSKFRTLVRIYKLITRHFLPLLAYAEVLSDPVLENVRCVLGERRNVEELRPEKGAQIGGDSSS